jgi:hypothetical protein
LMAPFDLNVLVLSVVHPTPILYTIYGLSLHCGFVPC